MLSDDPQTSKDEDLAHSATATPTGVDDTQCCSAAMTETWLSGPGDTRWVRYAKTGDTEQVANLAANATTPSGDTCCA